MNVISVASRLLCGVRLASHRLVLATAFLFGTFTAQASADTFTFYVPNSNPQYPVTFDGVPSGTALVSTGVVAVPLPTGAASGQDISIAIPNVMIGGAPTTYNFIIRGLPTNTAIAQSQAVDTQGKALSTTITVGNGQAADVGGICYAHIGVNCSVGLGEIFLIHPDIRSAIVQDNVIRITEEHKQEASAWFSVVLPIMGDSGNPLKPYSLFGFSGGAESGWLFGWWLGFQFGADNSGLLQGYGTGPFIGRRVTNGTSAGIGFGYAWTQATTLADGYVVDSAPPSGSSGVLTKTIDNGGWMIMAMFNF